MEQDTASQANTAASTQTVGNAIVLMEDIYEQLKLINYEEELKKKDSSFKPISPFYFAVPLQSNPTQQFHFFVLIVNWLLQDILKASTQTFDLYEDPITTCSNILFEIQKLGIPCEFLAAKLKKGFGDEVCHILYSILVLALEKLNFKFLPPIIPKQLQVKEEDTTLQEEGEEIEEIDENYVEQTEDEEEYFSNEQHASNELSSQHQMIQGGVAAEDWKLEMEQVAPKLILRINADHKDWRTHVDSMTEHKQNLEKYLQPTVTQLTKLAEEVNKVLERIRKREAMLSQDAVLITLLDTYKTNQEELEAATRRYKETEESISILSSELNTLNEELEQVKERVDLLGKKMADTTPLIQIKDALQKLKTETKQMDLRIGVLQHTVLQYKLKTSSRITKNQTKMYNSQSKHFNYDVKEEDEEEVYEN